MSIKKGFKFDIVEKDQKQIEAEKLASLFVEQLNLFHAQPSPRDAQLDLFLHQSYADVIRRNIQEGYKPLDLPYFSPSSSGSCPRELYLKVKGAEKDAVEVRPYQTRWQHIGTKIGDMIQEQVLLMERHLLDLTGVSPLFRFERNRHGEPLFEEFAYTKKLIKGKYYLMGTTDGILNFRTKDDKIIRVGLEIKSKQTSYSQTGNFSMKEANPKHVSQTVAYSLMYNVDYWIILYVNGSKKSWSMSEEDALKYPDVRAFGHYVTQDMKDQLLNKFDTILDCVDSGTPPKLDLTNWTFNNFKTACALDLSQAEFVGLIEEGLEIKRSSKPAFIKNSVEDALIKIDEIRGLHNAK